MEGSSVHGGGAMADSVGDSDRDQEPTMVAYEKIPANMNVLAAYAGGTMADSVGDWGIPLADFAGDNGTTITTTYPRATGGGSTVCGGRTMVDSIGDYDHDQEPTLVAYEKIPVNMDVLAAHAGRTMTDFVGDWGIPLSDFARDHGMVITTTNPRAIGGGSTVCGGRTMVDSVRDYDRTQERNPVACEKILANMNGLALYAGRTVPDFFREWGKTLTDFAGDIGMKITTINPRAASGVSAVCGGRTMADYVGYSDHA